MRIEREETIGKELGELQVRLERLNAAVAGVNARISEDIAARQDAAVLGLSVAEFQQRAAGIAYLEKKRSELLIEKLGLESSIEDKKIELTEAMKDRKTMEKLKENAFQEYMEAFEKNEQKITDELVSYNGAKKSAENDL